MDTRIEYDIAYIKAAVSEYARHRTHCDALKATIDQIGEELRATRSKLHQLDLFQSIIKGVFSGVGVVVAVALIIAMFKASASTSNDTTQKSDASQQAGTARPE